MDNNTGHDHSSDVANEHMKSGDNVKAGKQREKDEINGIGKQVKGTIDEGEKNEMKKEDVKTPDVIGVGEKNEKSKPVFSTTNEKISTSAISASLPEKEVPCPSPPARQRKKSKVNTDIEGKEMRVSGRNVKKTSEMKQNKEDTSVPDDARKTTKTKPDTALQNKSETGSEKPEIATETKENKNTRSSTRKREKNLELNNDKEEKQTSDNKKDIEKDDTNSSSVGLKKELGLINCVGIIVGNIIGTGIFVSPRAVLLYSGSVGMSLIVWVLSGVMSIVGAFCYAELGTMIPQSGGNYIYLYEAYGSFPAFIFLWMTVTIMIPGSKAIAALSFANYVLQPFFPDGQEPPDSSLRLVGMALLLFLCYVNYRRVRWATRVQDVLALTKVFALIVIIVVGMFHLNRGTTENYKSPMEGTTTNPALLATAFYHTFYAYEGWDSLNNIMEELKDPFRNMPRAIAISVSFVMVIYTLTNVAYFAVMPKDLILASPAVAVTFGNLALGVVAWTIPVFVACSISGGLNGSLFSNSRLLFVSSRQGHLPRFLSLVHIEKNTPVTSLFFLGIMSMTMFVTSDVRVLINYLGFAGNLMNLVCITTFFWFRIKRPDLPRPIKTWIGFPIIYVILALMLCVFPVVKQPLEVVAALAMFSSGIPVYYFFVYREKKPQWLLNAIDKITYVCQLFFMAVPEEKSS